MVRYLFRSIVLPWLRTAPISTIRTTIPATAPIRTFLGSCMILFIMSFTCFGILSLDNIFSTFISEKFIFVFFSGVSNGLPHLQQNFAPSTFSAPHFLQFIFLSCASQTYKRIHIRCLTDWFGQNYFVRSRFLLSSDLFFS